MVHFGTVRLWLGRQWNTVELRSRGEIVAPHALFLVILGRASVDRKARQQEPRRLVDPHHGEIL